VLAPEQRSERSTPFEKWQRHRLITGEAAPPRQGWIAKAFSVQTRATAERLPQAPDVAAQRLAARRRWRVRQRAWLSMPLRRLRTGANAATGRPHQRRRGVSFGALMPRPGV
jgi:hypothetical protein